MVKETLSVASVQSKVGGSFFIDMRKTDSSVEGPGPQPAKTKIIASNQQGKMEVCVFITIFVSIYRYR
jgi:hypothetical protein